MKKIALAASAAIAAMAMAPAANAAVVDPIVLTGAVTTDAFGGEVAAAGLFSDVFNFVLTSSSALTSASITSILTTLGGAGDIDFTSVTFDVGPAFTIFNNQFGDTDLAKVSGVFLAAGAHTLTVSGTAFASASYGGNINITRAPVPEPTTWAMMVAGIAAVGMTLRRRSHTARIAFS